MKSIRRKIKFLEYAQVRQLIDKIDWDGERGRRDRALLETLFSAGFRISEALALSRKMIESHPMWHQNKTLEISITGKGGWQRVIFISPKARYAIKDYLSIRTDTDERLFPITPRGVQKMIVKRGREAGIEIRLTPHMMRHSFATNLLRKGVDLMEVKEFLGHRAISSTQVYLHVTNAQLKNTHEKLYK